MTNSRWTNHRRVDERIIIEGTLELETPAHFGNGDVSAATDLPLAREMPSGKPLLTGASTAGALRSYLCVTNQAPLANQLFGEIKPPQKDDKEQQSMLAESALLVNDALAENAKTIELRDGVAVDSKTRAAEKGKKFDIELIPAGAKFDLSFELNITQDEQNLVGALAFALRGLESGAIGLGKRKTRGLGHCRVSEWRVRRYRVTEPQGLIAWLNDDNSNEKRSTGIVDALNVDTNDLRVPEVFSLSAKFALDGSLLIRDYGNSATSADAAHLHSRRNGNLQPIVSGTSLAGILRARALRIANTLANDSSKANEIVERMFGPRGKKELKASRVRVRETAIEYGTVNLVQSRVQIDRFTGGAANTALFSEQPLFGLPKTRVNIELDLVKARDQSQVNPAEIGLLLLVLKDLWTGDLPLGGESSVGRGRLRGLTAELRWGDKTWSLVQQDNKLSITGEAQKLEACVSALRKELSDAAG